MIRILFKFVAVALLMGVSVAFSIQIDGFSSALNDRFANDDSFIANSFDLSGIGRASNSSWGTLVSSNVIISANHFKPSVGGTVTFFETNDPNGASTTKTVTSGQRIGSSDLWLGVLDSPVSSSYTSYAIADEPATSIIEFSETSYALQNSYMVGRSPSSFSSNTDVAIGRNVLDNWVDDITAAGTTDDAVRAFQNEPIEPNYVSSEAIAEIGDSGAPMFVEIDSQLTIVGINWFIQSVGEIPVLTGFSYVGNYTTEINNFIAANPVPEPETFAFGIALAAFVAVLIRRKKQS